MDEIIEKIHIGKLYLSIPNSQIKAFDTVIHSQRELFGIQLNQTYAGGFKTEAKLMLEFIIREKVLID